MDIIVCPLPCFALLPFNDLEQASLSILTPYAFSYHLDQSGSFRGLALPIFGRPPMQMLLSPPWTASMCRVANYVLSIKRYCRSERRNKSSRRKPFGTCVPCSLRRNSSNSRRRHNHITIISAPLLHLPPLLNVRTEA